jgi:hypothetical protein
MNEVGGLCSSGDDGREAHESRFHAFVTSATAIVFSRNIITFDQNANAKLR